VNLGHNIKMRAFFGVSIAFLAGSVSLDQFAPFSRALGADSSEPFGESSRSLTPVRWISVNAGNVVIDFGLGSPEFCRALKRINACHHRIGDSVLCVNIYKMPFVNWFRLHDFSSTFHFKYDAEWQDWKTPPLMGCPNHAGAGVKNLWREAARCSQNCKQGEPKEWNNSWTWR
jgi:hypothetical protein